MVNKFKTRSKRNFDLKAVVLSKPEANVIDLSYSWRCKNACSVLVNRET